MQFIVVFLRRCFVQDLFTLFSYFSLTGTAYHSEVILLSTCLTVLPFAWTFIFLLYSLTFPAFCGISLHLFSFCALCSITLTTYDYTSACCLISPAFYQSLTAPLMFSQRPPTEPGQREALNELCFDLGINVSEFTITS